MATRRRRRKRRKTRRKRGRGLNSLLRHKGQRRGTHSSKPHGRRASQEALRRLERHKTRHAPRETRSSALRGFAKRVPPPSEQPPDVPFPTVPPPVTNNAAKAQRIMLKNRGKRAQLVRSGTPTFGEQFKGTGAANLASAREATVSEHYDPRDSEYALVARGLPTARQGKPSRRKRIAAWWSGKKSSGGRRRRSRRRRRRRKTRKHRGGANKCCIDTKCPPKGYSLVKNAPPPPPPPSSVAPETQRPRSGRGAMLGAISGFKRTALKHKKRKLKPKPKAKRSTAQAMGNAVAKRFKGARGSKKKDNGEGCSEHRECDSQYCNPETNECEDEPDEDWN